MIKIAKKEDPTTGGAEVLETDGALVGSSTSGGVDGSRGFGGSPAVVGIAVVGAPSSPQPSSP